MPIEIRELHVRMNVTEGAAGDGQGQQGPAAAVQADPRDAQDELVSRCVEQVMELLRNRTER